jgi:hypothetical protein
MTTLEYTTAVIEERKALRRLERLLKEHGAKTSKLDACDAAFAHWKQLAALLESAAAERVE